MFFYIYNQDPLLLNIDLSQSTQPVFFFNHRPKWVWNDWKTL